MGGGCMNWRCLAMETTYARIFTVCDAKPRRYIRPAVPLSGSMLAGITGREAWSITDRDVDTEIRNVGSGWIEHETSLISFKYLNFCFLLSILWASIFLWAVWFPLGRGRGFGQIARSHKFERVLDVLDCPFSLFQNLLLEIQQQAKSSQIHYR